MERIGRYEVVNRMGSGGFATVYRARDPHLDSEVAIKVLAENWTDNVEFKDRFMREAQLLRRIDSANVITVHDIGELGSGQPYFVMALADEGTLEDRLADRPPPSAEAATAIAERLADCVGTIHSHDLIHRDIKPSNLLISASRTGRQPAAPGFLEANERMLLGDFGLAKDTALTGTGLTISAGTGGYAAPEQMSPTGVPDQRTDLYAATAVLYRVISGTLPPPFDLASQSVPFLDGDWWMQGDLGLFLRRGMNFDQAQRHGSVDEWFDHLRGAVASSTGGGSAAATTTLRDDLTGRSGQSSGPTGGTAHWTPPPSSGPGGGSFAPGPSQPVVSQPQVGQPQYSQAPVSQPQVSQPAPGQSWPPSQPAAHQPHPNSMPQYSAPNDYSAPAGHYNGPQSYAPHQSAPAHSAPAQGYQQVATPFQSGPAGLPVVRKNSKRPLLLAIPVLALLAIAGYFLLFQSSGPTIEGPDQVRAGEDALFTVSLPGETVEEFRWNNFDGNVLTGNTFTVTGILPGSLTLRVVGVVNGVETDAATKTVKIIESDLGPTIEGPDTVPVNGQAVYTYREQATLTNPRWRDPNGNELAGFEYVVSASQAGSFTVTLIVTTPDGKDIGSKKEIELIN